MENIYIIGASGFAKEVFSLIMIENIYNVAAFIDVSPTKKFLEIGGFNIPIIDEMKFLENQDLYNSNIAIGIGSPQIIRRIFSKYSNYCFPNIISSKSVLGLDVKLGRGNIITQNVIFTTNIEIGNGNIFNLSSTVGHDCKIGDFNVINPAVNISGGVKLGNENLLGVGSIILQYINIGSLNIIGGSSLVTKSIEDNKLVIGVPGKIKE